ncbi:MAG: hypothetical protein FGM57_00210 [Candidatus Taylorbacteria bacterium]|nr:hypothetical protein [Candidatus Taylorbacteria bacterium]
MSKGFTLIEISIYISLLSVLGVVVLDMYMGTQYVFQGIESTYRRKVMERYISLQVKSLDFKNILGVSGGTVLAYNGKTIIDVHSLERVKNILGEVLYIHFNVNKEFRIIDVTYQVRIAKKIFNEQHRIYLI